MKKLYVGNLPYGLNNAELRDIFQDFGDVASASVVMDRETGRSRGFGFVEIADDRQAEQAIEKMNGADCQGRNLVVNEARPREARGAPRGGGGGRW